MRRGVRKALLAIDVPDHWSSERDAKKRESVSSGYTSVRITKRTAAALEQLRHELARGRDGHGEESGFRWGYQIPMTELLDWIAAGLVIFPDRELAAACRSAIAKKHAESDGDRMQSQRPPAVHASGDR